jgi:endoglucanase
MHGRAWGLVAILAAVWLCLLAGCGNDAEPVTSISSEPPGPPPGRSTAPRLSVSGTHLVDGRGHVVQLNGVNRTSAEFPCALGEGIFDGPTDDASVAAMVSWHVHAVRLPLNTHCWLGEEEIDPAFAGDRYQAAVKTYVARLEAAGLNVILDLHLSAPGSKTSVGYGDTLKMPDAEHAVPFWQSVAQQYGRDTAMMFDLFNEPHDVSWECWRDGCKVDGYQAAGMQQLVDTVRSAGAMNVLLLSGLEWAADVRQWNQFKPTDPLHKLVAGWHLYNWILDECELRECLRSAQDGVRGNPLLIGELGEDDCKHSFVDEVMTLADEAGIGYLPWSWGEWGANCEGGPLRGPVSDGGPNLIRDYDGTPTSYGTGVRDHFISRFP